MDTIICAEHLPRNRFIVAGQVQDVGYFNEVIDYIKEKDLKNIDLLYNISHHQKELLYRDIDVLHYPTENEAFCFSILEGMQRWKAVVSYNNSAIPELDHNKSLFLVEDNLGSLLEATVEYSKNPDKIVNDAIKNRKVYEEYYTGDTYVKNMKELYDAI